MKKIFAMAAISVTTATGAWAAEITPYFGMGIVIDKAGNICQARWIQCRQYRYQINP